LWLARSTPIWQSIRIAEQGQGRFSAIAVERTFAEISEDMRTANLSFYPQIGAGNLLELLKIPPT
jgi:hypothetical protein